MTAQYGTVIDVIENFWGTDPLRRIPHASLSRIERFGDEVTRFYDSFVPPPLDEAEFRTYVGDYAVTHSSQDGPSMHLMNNLLYAHSTIVSDPLPLWYFPRIDQIKPTPTVTYADGTEVDQSEKILWTTSSFNVHRQSLDNTREVLRFYVRDILCLKPLIQAGIVIPVSQAHIVEANTDELIAAAIRDATSTSFLQLCRQPIDEAHPVWDNVRGFLVAPKDTKETDKILYARAKESSYYINKSLVIAEAASGQYIPSNETDFALLRHTLMTSSQELGVLAKADTSVVQRTLGLSVPSLEGITCKDLIAIRQGEEAFEDFRMWLGSILRQAGNSGDEATAIASREIDARIKALRVKLQTSSVLQSFLKDDGFIIAITTFIAALAQDPRSALCVGGASTLAAALRRLILRGQDESSNQVLLQLAKMRRTAPDAIVGSTPESRLPKVLGKVFVGKVKVGKPRTAIQYGNPIIGHQS